MDQTTNITDSQVEFLSKAYLSFTNGLKRTNSAVVSELLKDLGIHWSQVAMGYNSGQFHHRKSEEFKAP